jgi:hypothetical protein
MSYPDVRLLDKEIECLLRDHNAIEIQRMGLSNRAALDFLNDQDDRILNLVESIRQIKRNISSQTH